MEFIEEYRGYKIYITSDNTYMIDCKKKKYKTIGSARQGIAQTIKNINTNDYIIHKKYAEIVITSKKFGVFKTKIDIEDIEKCKKYIWNVNKCYHHKEEDFYIGASTENNTVLLHRYLTDCPKDYQVDHRDGNTFNNRKGNLRVCTRMQNAKNRKMNRNNSSGVKGVSWDRFHERWIAHLCINGKKTTLGNFVDFDEAVEARKEAEKKYQGEFNRHAEDYIEINYKDVI